MFNQGGYRKPTTNNKKHDINNISSGSSHLNTACEQNSNILQTNRANRETTGG